MQTAISYSIKGSQPPAFLTFTPLALETRPAVNTTAAAYYLSRRPQTLRGWACKTGTGPLEPIRVNGRLAWPTQKLRELLCVVPA